MGATPPRTNSLVRHLFERIGVYVEDVGGESQLRGETHAVPVVVVVVVVNGAGGKDKRKDGRSSIFLCWVMVRTDNFEDIGVPGHREDESARSEGGERGDGDIWTPL